MKRWDSAIAYIGSGEYAADMEESDEGEYVRHADHAEALLAALRREKAALDKVDALQAMAVRALADKDAEIKRLNDVIGEMCE